jgi:MFS family permease
MKNNFKITAINNIGAILEYYDYIIYALLAEYISQIFFPAGDAQANILKTILIFITGAFARIVSSSVLGLISDKIGRKFNLMLSVMMMAIATLGIGLLPSYQSIGIYAPILLTLLRFTQGLAYSVEIPSTAVFFSEQDKKSTGLRVAGLISSATIGAIMATLTMFIITSFYSPEEIISYVWRVPFLIGGSIGFLGYWIRTGIPEDKINIPQTNFSKQFISNNLVKLLQGVGIILLPACLVVNNLYFPGMLSKFYGYMQDKIYFFTTLSLIFSAIMSPIFGVLIDKFKPQTIIKYLGVSFISSYLLLNYGLTLQSNSYLLFFLLCHQFFLTGFINAGLVMITGIFEVELKCTLTSLAYNIAFIIAAFSPLIIRYYDYHMLIALTPLLLLLSCLFTTSVMSLEDDQ